MLRSIRWTLLLWHALLLAAVVCVFGGTLYFQVRRARFQSIDTELQATAQVLAAQLRPAFGPRPPRPPAMRPPPPRPDLPPGRERGPDDRPAGPGPGAPWEPGRPGPGPGRGGPGGPGGPGGFGAGGPPGGAGFMTAMDPAFVDEFERRLEVPEPLLERFQGDDARTPYYAIWRSNGELHRTSRALLDLPDRPARQVGEQAPPRFRLRGELREVIVPAGPGAMQVLVGRSIHKEQGELRQLLGLLVAIGAAVMLVGLAGGWLLSKRAVRPIQTISATAQTISASNLSRRIDAAEMESELATLARVLNAMFGRLEAAFDRQVRFTADASHELRTPLSIIYSHAELALSKPRTAEEYHEAIETCFRAAKRMKSLVDSLLVLARADAGKLEIRHEPVDLRTTVADCAALVGPLAVDKKVEVKLDLEPATVSGDPFRLAQVVTNLLTNALHYNREGGSVTVGLKSDGTEVVLTVADTGVGIADEDQQHLFERFYRVDKARSRQLGGSGLGLAICKSIIEVHGGTIACASRLGEGATFTARLPRTGGPTRG